MTENKLVIGLGVGALVVLLAVLVVNLSRPTPIVQVQLPEEAIKYGAMPGPSLSFQQFCVNGVCKDYYFERALMSTSTPFAIKCPSATSSIESLIHNIYIATTTAIYYDYSTSTSRYASSTAFANQSVSASAKGVFKYIEATNSSLCYPNTYIVVKGAGTDVAHLVASSTLTVILREINER